MKIVFDSNVIISAFTTEGLAHKVFSGALENNNIFISEKIIEECKKALKKSFKFSELDIKFFTKFIFENLIQIEPVGEEPNLCRDPNDNHVLHLIEYIKSSFLITGDKDLLVLNDYKNCEILNPRQYFELHLTKNNSSKL